MNLLEVVKRAAIDAVKAEYPVAVMTGTVTSASPLEVSIDQRFKLSEAFLLVPESLQAFAVNLSHDHEYDEGTTDSALTEPVAIRRGLETGDVVLLLRIQGGQQFVIMDRLVQP